MMGHGVQGAGPLEAVLPSVTSYLNELFLCCSLPRFLVLIGSLSPSPLNYTLREVNQHLLLSYLYIYIYTYMYIYVFNLRFEA